MNGSSAVYFLTYQSPHLVQPHFSATASSCGSSMSLRGKQSGNKSQNSWKSQQSEEMHKLRGLIVHMESNFSHKVHESVV